MKRFILFSGKRHPRERGAAEVTAFLNHLAGDRNVAAATQNQALAALLFLYKRLRGQVVLRKTELASRHSITHHVSTRLV